MRWLVKYSYRHDDAVNLLAVEAPTRLEALTAAQRSVPAGVSVLDVSTERPWHQNEPQPLSRRAVAVMKAAGSVKKLAAAAKVADAKRS